MIQIGKENQTSTMADGFRKSNSVPRKIFSKQKKAIQYIGTECKITLGIQPSKNIVICNSGLPLGLSEKDVLQIFGPYGTIETVIMLPDKTYCFVAFCEPSNALEAYHALHGKSVVPRTENLIVLAFAEEVPQTIDPWAHTSTRDGPPGLVILQDFVSEKEEEILVKLLVWADKSNGAQLKHRKVQHFGYAFRYGSNDVDNTAPLEKTIPDECGFIRGRLIERANLQKSFHPDQLTVNRYFPGQGIPPHVDTHSVFDDTILSLSLLSDVVMDFKNKSGRRLPVLLPRRSLVIMSGESRYGWTHGIASRLHDIIRSDTQGLTVLPRGERISFTFRQLRQAKECFCSYPWFCDTQQHDESQQQLDAIQLEKQYVQEVYENISDHFSETRHTPWPNITEFCRTFKTGQILIDVGCGNGKYFGQQTDNVSLLEIGIDASAHLAEECSKRGVQVLNGNCLNLPFRSNIADGVLCIAVIHHLATHERRQQAVQEITRVLCKGGKALIYVWAREQRLKDEMSTYLKQNRKNWHAPAEPTVLKSTDLEESPVERTTREEVLPIYSSNENSNEICSDLPLPVHVNRTNFKHTDVLVPWKLKGRKVLKSDSKDEHQIFYRYYHVFEADELEKMCLGVPDVEVLETKYDQGNWTILLQKQC